MNINRALVFSVMAHGALLMSFAGLSHKFHVGVSDGSKNISVSILSSREQRTAPPISTSSEARPTGLAVKKLPSSKDLEPKSQAKTYSQKRIAQLRQESSAVSAYIYNIQKSIEDKKFYPSLARRLKLEGLVNADFVLGRSGQLIEIKKIESEHEALSVAVKKLISEDIKFPAFPEGIEGETMELKVPVRFSLKN